MDPYALPAHAQILDVVHTRRFSDRPGLIGFDALLKPEGPRADLNRLSGDVRSVSCRPENVNHVDTLLDVKKGWVALLAQDLTRVGVDWDHSEAPVFKEVWDVSRRLSCVAGGAHNSHSAGVFEDLPGAVVAH